MNSLWKQRTWFSAGKGAFGRRIGEGTAVHALEFDVWFYAILLVLRKRANIKTMFTMVSRCGGCYLYEEG